MEHLLSLALSFALIYPIMAENQDETFETAAEAVANMRVGWNLGNTLDSHSGDTAHMWIEWNNPPLPKHYETAWGQPTTTRELIHMMKEAGFGAIRVPVTWYPHMGIQCESVQANGKLERYWFRSKWTGTTVDAQWMARVKEVVDYVIDEGLYCILNVHHDTGTSNTHWLIADESNYAKEQARFESLWTQIANEFKDYDEHLLFEGYNEMTDSYDSWCFASFGTANGYNSQVATSAYNAINNYVQSFVNAVRATGGRNEQRNLIVCTYAACSGEGSWSSHLLDPLKQMKLPTDIQPNHLCFEVHAYPSIKSNLSSAKSSVKTMMSNLATYLGKSAPVIIGEWGTANDGPSGDDYKDYKANKLNFAQYFVEQAKAKGHATFYWMGISDGSSRSVPKFSQEDLKDAIMVGYYGEGGYVADIKELPNDAQSDIFYDLSGNKVENPTHGLFIRNGRKILLK